VPKFYDDTQLLKSSLTGPCIKRDNVET